MQRSLSEINFEVGIWQHACQDLQFGLSNFNLPSIVSLLFYWHYSHLMLSLHEFSPQCRLPDNDLEHSLTTQKCTCVSCCKGSCTFVDCFSFLIKEWFWSECMDIHCPPVSSSHGTWSSEIPTSSFRACGSFYLRCKWKLNKFLLVLKTLIHAVS